MDQGVFVAIVWVAASVVVFCCGRDYERRRWVRSVKHFTRPERLHDVRETARGVRDRAFGWVKSEVETLETRGRGQP